jgi:hypothetical protein
VGGDAEWHNITRPEQHVHSVMILRLTFGLVWYLQGDE